MNLQERYLALSEAVFNKYDWIITDEIVEQRRAICETFENYDNGFQLLPIECGGGKSVSTGIYTMLDTDNQYLVAVNTIKEANEFVESWNQHEKLALRMGLVDDAGTCAALHSKLETAADKQKAMEARVMVICHAGLSLAMLNPKYAEQLGLPGERRMIIDEYFSMISTREHLDNQLEKLHGHLDRYVQTEEFDQIVEYGTLDRDEVHADMADLKSLIDCVDAVGKDERVDFIAGPEDGRAFPRSMKKLIHMWTLRDSDNQELNESMRVQWQSVSDLAETVYRGWSAVLSAHDDYNIRGATAHLVETRSIVPRSWKNGIILDATARIRSKVVGQCGLGDMIPHANVSVVDIKPIRDYSNVTVDIVYIKTASHRGICQGNNGYESEWGWFSNNLISLMGEAIRTGEKALVIGHKQMGSLLEEQNQLDNSVFTRSEGMAEYLYWNNGHRGSNAYADCSRGYIFSNLVKPSWLYKLSALASDLGLQSNDPEFNNRWQAERTSDMIEEMIQATNRLAHRIPEVSEDGRKMKTRKSRMTIFVPSTSKAVVQGKLIQFSKALAKVMKSEMPGIKINMMPGSQAVEQVPGISVDQRRTLAGGKVRDGVHQHWTKLMQYVEKGIENNDEVLVSDAKLQELAPHTVQGFKIKKTKLVNGRQGSASPIIEYFRSRGSKVEVSTVRGQGILVSKAA